LHRLEANAPAPDLHGAELLNDEGVNRVSASQVVAEGG